ncbi:hypothetical protein FRB99_004642 [Tulasnella sp. 403]|nr:hypothetical protein FRB99_004642 [Tulasnella sp. 403]
MKDVSDGDVACVELLSVVGQYTEIITGIINAMNEDYIHHSDDPQAKMAREAIPTFQRNLEDTKEFLASYMKGNWFSRYTKCGDIENYAEQADTAQKQFKSSVREITRINVNAIRELVFLSRIAGAKQIPLGDICITKIGYNTTGRVRSDNFWEEIVEARIENQVRLVKVYDTSRTGISTFLQELKHLAMNRFIPYLLNQAKVNNTVNLLTAWSMLIDMKDAATFIYENNSTMSLPYTSLKKVIERAVVDEAGRVMIALPSKVATTRVTTRKSDCSTKAVQYWRWNLKWPRARAYRALSLALFENADTVLSTKRLIPETVDEASHMLRQWWSQSPEDRYTSWCADTYDKPVPGDIGILERPDLRRFRKLGNVAAELGGTRTVIRSPSPKFAELNWADQFSGNPGPGVYQFTVPPRKEQAEGFRRPTWTIDMQWCCEMENRHLEWDFLLKNAKRLGQEHGISPSDIILVTETVMVLYFEHENLRGLVDGAEAAMHYRVHIDGNGLLTHQYWSLDDKLLTPKEVPQLTPSMTELGCPPLDHYHASPTQWLEIEEADLEE